MQLERTVAHTESFKLDIFIKKGAHNTEEESKQLLDSNFPTSQLRDNFCNHPLVFFSVSVNKQINDKERIAAAMENPNLRKIVEECIQNED